MNSTASTEKLLLDLLQAQEAMRAEFSQLTRLCENLSHQIEALKNRSCIEVQQRTSHSASLSLPSGLISSRGTIRPGKGALDAVWRDIQGAFHPAPDTLLPNAAYILYRQIQALNLQGRRVAAITTPHAELADLLNITKAVSAQEFRASDINGPIEAIEYASNTSPISRNIFSGLHSLPTFLKSCDFLWIPDRFLASLLLRCNGIFEGFVERVHRQLLFTLDTEDWEEHDARSILHRVGFIEVSRPFETGENLYITRMHESQSYYSLTGTPPSSEDGPLYLLASKVPSPSFRITPAGEKPDES
ncbi:MAG: hypothetical protein RBR77_11970 [Thauera sp.]|jgi:hypothetical protein|nr:hypothetical protein [Thauera sp.]